jgi:hypothetical protein
VHVAMNSGPCAQPATRLTTAAAAAAARDAMISGGLYHPLAAARARAGTAARHKASCKT